MSKENPVVLIYKRNHTGDPDQEGIFGINRCMQSKRSLVFGAVIGIGAKRAWQGYEKIANKINYVGLGAKPHSTNPDDNHPYVIFDNFRLFDEEGEFVETFAPNLYKYMYGDANVRFIKSDSSRIRDNVLIQSEIQKILALAENSPPSSGYENLPVTKETLSTNNDGKGGCK